MSNNITAWLLAASFGLIGGTVSTARADQGAQPSGTSQNGSGWRQKLEQERSSVGTTVEGAANETEHTANSIGQEAGNVAQKAGGKTASGAKQAGAATGDAAITSQVKAQLAAHEPDAAGVGVDTAQGVVTLTGTVDSLYLRQRAVELTRNTKGVKEVQDHISVQNQK